MPLAYPTPRVPLPLTPRSLPGWGATAARRSSGGLGFVLFLLVNAALLVRPHELVQGGTEWPLYNVAILACLLVSFPCVFEQLTSASLHVRPITVCVVGLLPAVVLSHLSHLAGAVALVTGFEFFKLAVYYLLLVGLVNSPARMRRLLFWVPVFIATLAGVALLQYHGVIHLSVRTVLQDHETARDTGQEVTFSRLVGTGIFGDPNELATIVVVGALLSLYWLSDRRSGIGRFAWLAPLGVLLVALAETKSRGGLIALLAGLLILCRARFGWGKTILVGAVLLPLLGLAFGGRQTQISTAETTGQERIQLWSEGLALLPEAPLFGIGMDQYVRRVGKVAHNSFLHCYVELGWFGGTLFVGAFYLALRGVRQVGRRGRGVVDPELLRMAPYLMAVVAGFAGAMLSLSLANKTPTYLVLGLAAGHCRLGADSAPWLAERCDARLLRRLVLVSALALGAIYLFVRTFATW